MSVYARIQQNAEHTPSSIALAWDGGNRSYGELWDTARAWAGGAMAVASTAPAIIGVLHHRSPELPSMHLAAWMLGVPYLPLDPALPPGRLAAIIKESGCEVVLTEPDLIALLPHDVRPVASFGSPLSELAADSPQRAAYVIYTSGSTGTPKGVAISHGNLAALDVWYRSHYELHANAVTSMFSNVAFDCLVVDVWPTLSAGGTVAIPDQSIIGDALAMSGFLERFDVVHSQMPTFLFESFLGSRCTPAGLRTIETGADVLRSWPPDDYPIAVHNSYGPTEATVQVTVTDDLRTYRCESKVPGIGRAIAGSLLRLVEGDEVRTDPGSEGELFIGGPFVGLGYWRRPDLEADRFVEIDGERWYRTGDVCRWAESGDELEFVGRADTQIQVSGYRVEPAEVERAVLEIDGVRQAYVLPVKRDGAVLELAVVVEGVTTLDAVRAHLSPVLPGYMVPRHLVRVDRLPQSPNGKVDRAALAALVSAEVS